MASRLTLPVSNRSSAGPRSGRQRDRFLALLSHELRNPLGAIVNAGFVLHRTKDNPEDLAGAIHVIERQSTQMNRLLDDLLDVSRITQNKIQLKRKAMSLNELCEEAGPRGAFAFESKQVSLQICQPASVLRVNGDDRRLQQIVVNLLANAAKYTPAGGHVTLSLEREENDAWIRVKDRAWACGRTCSSVFSICSFRWTRARSLGQRAGRRADAGAQDRRTSWRDVCPPATAWVKAVSSLLRFLYLQPLQTTARRRSRTPPRFHPAESSLWKTTTTADGCWKRFCVWRDTPCPAFMTARKDSRPFCAIAPPSPSSTSVCPASMATKSRRTREEVGDSVFLVALTGYGQPEDHKAVMEAGFNDHLVKPLNLEQLQAIIRNALSKPGNR